MLIPAKKCDILLSAAYQFINKGDMAMANENALSEWEESMPDEEAEEFDLDELEEGLQAQLDESLADLQFLEEEKEKIGSPDNLGEVIKDVVWEQFINQIADKAGEDFIRENNGLTLDLSNDAHIQTTENFASGKIASHNTEIDYQQRYDDWQSNFAKDENGNIITHQTRSGREEATLVKGARKPFDEGRPSGSAERHTDMDHTVSAAEIIRDPAMNAHMTKEEQIAFANSDANLNEMDSSMNRSKGDTPMKEWLENTNSKGQKPDEIFDISDEEKQRLMEKDEKARREKERLTKEAEKRSIEAGKKSQRQEAFRIGGKALRAAVMTLLASLVKEIISKMVKWFKSAKKSLQTLLDGLKEAILSFIKKLKENLIAAGNTVISTIMSAIIGPLFSTIKKAWMLIKKGWESLKKAVDYLKDPANKKQPLGRRLMEVGKIIIAGLTGAGALILGEVIEKGLMAIPVFAFEIPLIGSLANILGIFLGAVVSGIIGAIAINLIEKMIEKSMKRQNTIEQIDKGNEILSLQHQLQYVTEAKLEQTKATAAQSIYDRHVAAAEAMAESIAAIKANSAPDESLSAKLDELDKLFDEWED